MVEIRWRNWSIVYYLVIILILEINQLHRFDIELFSLIMGVTLGLWG